LELPYLLYSDYASTTPITPTLEFSGQFDIVVLNDIRAPETCSQSVNVQWFISAGDDFEVSVPGQMTSGALPFSYGQSDGTELVRESVEQGMEMPSMEIGGKSTTKDPLFHSKRCIGEKILSIKSYLLRNSVINGVSNSTFDWTTSNTHMIDPYFISIGYVNGTTGLPVGCLWGGDHYSLLASMYAYSRGGMRYTLIDGTSNQRLYSSIVPSNGFFGTQPLSTVALAKLGVFANYVNFAGANGTYPLEPCNIQDQSSYVYQHVPYYNRLPMTLNTYYDGTSIPSSDPGRSVSTLYISSGAAMSSNIVFQRAVADDFQLMFFTGCPPLCTAYS